MGLSRDNVEAVALLGRLSLSDDELARMTSQLGQIIDYFRQLDEIDTTHVEPMAHAAELSNVFAEDQRSPSLPREKALENAPKRDTECYRVPAVLGD
jgi:aspartyl-tRNA(Asn)/glutamyl-tRNA(Gln) amidotransferase subunit C